MDYVDLIAEYVHSSYCATEPKGVLLQEKKS